MNIIPWVFDWRDYDFFRRMSDNTYFTWFMTRRPHPQKPEACRAWVVRDAAGNLIAWAHVEPFTDPHKAHVARLGICVDPEHSGNGIGYELSKYVVERAREMGLLKVWATYHSDNAAVARIYEKLGFHVEGHFEAEELWNGQYKDVVSVSLFLERTMHCEAA